MRYQHVFSIAPIEMVRDHRLTAAQYRVLLALLSFRNREGNLVWPSRERLAELTGYTVNSISKYTRQLEELGWLKKIGKGGRSKSVKYRITVPNIDLDSGKTVSNPETVSNPDTKTAKTLSNPDTKTLSNLDRGIRTDQGTDQEILNRPGRVRARARETDDDPGLQVQPPTPKIRPKNGTRLPDDWTPPEDWIAWAREHTGWGRERVLDVADRFRDYWVSVPGAKGRKRDWLATWRNWVRRELDDSGNRAPSTIGRRPAVGNQAAIEESIRQFRASKRIIDIG